jgi:hypothetical protein
LKEKWGINKSHGYRLIEAAELKELLSPIGDVLPTEAVARELSGMSKDEQIEAAGRSARTPSGGI